MTTKGKTLLKFNLIINMALVFLMVMLGGLTRLTGSGLSIVEWDLITGILPPLNESDWQILFEAYQRTPEFKQINFDFTVKDFKDIFWLEYFHRILGRLIGIAYLAPLIVCVIFKKDCFSYLGRYLGLFLLVSLQGLMGWLMVKSGLSHEPHVSHYRLAVHLLLAFTLYGATLVTYAQHFMVLPSLDNTLSPFKRHIYAIIGLAFLTTIYGAFVAGLKAGLVYNTFPLMNGSLFPEQMFYLQPFTRNFFDNHGTVQFIHRFLALATLSYVMSIGYQMRRVAVRPHPMVTIFIAVMLIGLCQVTLGVLTVLYSVPTILGLLHQATALIFISLLLVLFACMHSTRNTTSLSIKTSVS